MRISTAAYFQRGITQIQDNMKAVSDTQQSIATGKKIQNTSDDPIASIKIQRLKEDLAISEQFKKNMDFVENRGELSDSILASVDVVIQRVKELTVQANSAVIGPVERKAIAVEVRQRQEELLGLMNTRDANGEHLFAGFKGSDIPFSIGDNGAYEYQGDEGQRFVKVAPTLTMAVSDSGKEIFVDVPSSEISVQTQAGSTNSKAPLGTISIGNITDQERLTDAYPEDFIIEFQPLANSTPAGSINFNVYQRSDQRPVFGDIPAGQLNNVVYTQGMSLEFNGIEVQLNGQPQVGDVFTVESTSKVDLLTTIERFASSLENSTIDEFEVSASAEVLGIASPPRASSAQAGNYIAAQTITVTGDDGTVQYATVNRNEDAGSIAATLSALTGVITSVDPTSAVLDFSSTAAVAGDTIEFSLNGTLVQAVAGVNSAATYTAIESALTTAFPLPPVTIANNGNGQFEIQEANSANIAIDDFLVNDLSGTAAAATLMVVGSAGAPVTLLESGNDSTAIAAQLTVASDANYDIQSDVPSQSGGIIAAETNSDEALMRFQESIARALNDIDLAQISVLETRTEVGARLNILDTARTAGDEAILATQTFLSKLSDVDFAEAASDLSIQTFVLEAAQNSFVRISNLSLFNFLR